MHLFINVGHILRHKINFSKSKSIEITQIIFTNQNRFKLGVNNRMVPRVSLNIWKLNDILLNSLWIKEEIKII